MRKRVVLLLLLTLPLPLAWYFVEDVKETYDWFAFVEFYQAPRWYVHYSAYHLENIIKTFVIFILSAKFLSRQEKYLAFVFLLYSVYRFYEYWLFRHHLPHLPVVGIVLFLVFFIYHRRNDG